MAVLPDLLSPGLKVVFCGTAVGNRSTAVRAYYAGRGNQFWAVLHRIGLTPRVLEPSEYSKLLEYGIGLTDLAKNDFGNDEDLSKDSFDVQGLRRKLQVFAPRAVAFNGKRGAEIFLGRSVEYGRQSESVGTTAIFVLPSTSGAARGYWDERYWLELASFIRSST
ncbi:MAG TPA: mismatch-specific DNA-glycosylase [Firmicutes bacterium]|nr:mismatch-specific DNA-glycosylase [Candidatus Fermentithermobacillaceae bacterium]